MNIILPGNDDNRLSLFIFKRYLNGERNNWLVTLFPKHISERNYDVRGDVTVTGNQAKLDELLSYMDSFDFWFNIVTP